ncbi:MAG TPA: hypothetical protein P5317_11625 [Myxococcota bacterium]|nr:hypothetical protein [Myxococcota bacterium]HRV18643.1 hypothetical protein [Myxococcota bacterium]
MRKLIGLFVVLALLAALFIQGAQSVFGNIPPENGNYITPEAEPQQIDASNAIKLPCGRSMIVRSTLYVPTVYGLNEGVAPVAIDCVTSTLPVTSTLVVTP